MHYFIRYVIYRYYAFEIKYLSLDPEAWVGWYFIMWIMLRNCKNNTTRKLIKKATLARCDWIMQSNLVSLCLLPHIFVYNRGLECSEGVGCGSAGHHVCCVAASQRPTAVSHARADARVFSNRSTRVPFHIDNNKTCTVNI